MPAPFRPHLLVVDDEACIHEALTAALGATYVVHLAASGAEACALLDSQPIAGIILDVVLGDEHGLELIPRFRTLSAVPILVLTGHSCEAVLLRSLREKVDEYLKKPVNLAELQAAIHRLVPPTDSGTDLAERARRCLDEQYAKPVALADLAGQLGICEAYLRRIFRTVYGKTPRRYLTERRMGRGAALLQTTSRAVEQIAADVGYPSSTLFGRAFRVAFRMSPSEYRAKSREESP